MKEAIINEQTVQGLMGNSRILSEFPFIATMAKRANNRPQSCCGRAPRAHVNLQAIKLSIFGMGQADQTRLKGLLGVDKLVFYLPGQGGVVRVDR